MTTSGWVCVEDYLHVQAPAGVSSVSGQNMLYYVSVLFANNLLSIDTRPVLCLIEQI